MTQYTINTRGVATKAVLAAILSDMAVGDIVEIVSENPCTTSENMRVAVNILLHRFKRDNEWWVIPKDGHVAYFAKTGKMSGTMKKLRDKPGDPVPYTPKKREMKHAG